MTKYREILRLTALGLSLRNIERSINVSRKTIVKVQKRAEELSLSWPLDDSFTDAELEQLNQLMKKRDELHNKELLQAIEHSNRSFEEIMDFLTADDSQE